MNQIGIKLADGSFYPVLDEGVSGRKRLVLTTVRDNQDTVQIDLYRGQALQAQASDYIGSLSVGRIRAAAKNDPEIELVLGVDQDGTLEATAADLLGGDRKSLSIDLGESGGAREPEFEREGTATLVKRDGGDSEENLLTGETYPIGPGDRRKEHLHRRGRRPLLLVAFVVLALVLIAAIMFVVFRSVDGQRVPPLFGGDRGRESVAAGPEAAPPAVEAAPPAVETAPPAAEAAPPVVETAPPLVEQKKNPVSTPAAGLWYNIKRGDTLWDIADAYYRNPWLYPKIARANKIANPDLILAGSKLFIPEQ